MATKKQRRAKAMKAQKKKQNLRLFTLSLIIMVCVGFLVFLSISLFDYIYGPSTDRGSTAYNKEKVKAQLYFSDSNERFLIPELRYLPKEKTGREQVARLVEALIEGPHTNLVETLPKETTLRSVEIKSDGTAYLDFDRNFISLHPGGSASEIMTVYSLTNTITLNVPDVRNVKLLVEGKEIESIKGHVDTRYPFTTNRELIVESAS